MTRWPARIGDLLGGSVVFVVLMMILVEGGLAAEPVSVPSLQGEEVQELPTVVVTATRSERSLKDLPVSVTVMDRKQIRDSPALATDDIIRVIPSLNLPLFSSFNTHPTNNLAGFRGLGAPRVLFMIDGMPINDPFNGFVQFNKIPRESLERVEVVRGGSSSLWGNFAMGGVINFITRPVDSTTATLNTSYGSNSTFRTNLHASQLISERFGMSANVTYFDTNGFDIIPPEIRGAGNVPVRSKVANVMLKGDYRGDHVDWSVRGNFLTTDSNTPGTHVSNVQQNTVELATNARWRLDVASDVRGSVFFLQQTLESDNADPIVSGNFDAFFLSNRHRVPTTDIGASLQYTHRLSDVIPEVLGGVDVRRIKGSDRQTLFNAPGALSGLQTSGGTQLFGGLFAQASLTPLDGLEILPSVRMDYYGMSDTQNELSDGGGTTNPTPSPDKHFIQPNPKLAVRYQLAEPIGLRAAFYRAFRAPTLGEAFGNFTSVGFGLRPNPLLKPEVLYGGEAGVDVELGRVSGQVNYFWNEVNDQIVGVPVSFFPIFALQNQNLGKVQSRGVEVMGQVKATDTLSLLVGYTYTDSRIRRSINSLFDGKRTPMVPLNFATFTLQYADPRGLMMAVRGRYLGTQFSFPGNAPDDTDRIKGEFILDVSASYAVNQYLTVFLIGENLTDRTYVASRRDGPQLAAPFQMFGGVRLTAF